MRLFLYYDTGDLTRRQVVKIGRCFASTLAAMADRPSEDYRHHRLLALPEAHELLYEWNDSATDFRYDRCFQELFEEQVERAPEATALDGLDRQMTFRELNRRANRLAHLLRTHGIGPELTVGACFESPAEMVVAILGIVKAGGVYLPLDPGFPESRLRFMISDARVSALVTDTALAQQIRFQDGPTIFLDRDDLSRHSAENPPGVTTPDNLAYVIYTSGSTGRPKGVGVPHRGLCNLVGAQTEIFGVRPAGRVLQFATFSFDASISEVFVTLCAGATLCLAHRDALLPGPSLHHLLSTLEVRLITLPPTALAVMPDEHLPALETLVVAGEPCPAREVARWSRGRLFINAYGPIESSVNATAFRATARGGALPIGRPIANAQIHVVGLDLHSAPMGTLGELCIAGVCLARGYLARPGLTALRFISHNLGGRPGSRLYRTGDLARFLPDGNVEFLGRTDQQVKVRGFRIEPGELEAVLRAQEKIEDALVMARKDHAGNQQLVTYVLTQEMKPREIRSCLQGRLPEFMIPTGFVILVEFPLTASGKVDRKALPEPERAGDARSYVAPGSREEKLLADIWAEVLGAERVGIHDNFFEFGGDSILSIQIMARARQAGLGITVKQMFQQPTIAELVEVMGTGPAAESDQGLVTGSVVLTPIQTWFFAQNPAEPHHFNQSVLLRVAPGVKPAWLRKALGALLSHHDALRSRFVKVDGQWRQEVAASENLSLVTAKVANLRSAVERLQGSMDLANGPLMRVALLRSPSGRDDRLFLAIHHLVVDGVSWRILLEDLQAAYAQLARGEEIVLPPKTTSFKEWSRRMTEYAR